jgi:hypothetical protein
MLQQQRQPGRANTGSDVMVIGGSSESGATTESHPGRQPQIAVNQPLTRTQRRAFSALSPRRGIVFLTESVIACPLARKLGPRNRRSATLSDFAVLL